MTHTHTHTHTFPEDIGLGKRQLVIAFWYIVHWKTPTAGNVQQTAKERGLKTKHQRNIEKSSMHNRQDPPPWFEFLVIFDFLEPWYRTIERHLLWKFHKKIQRKSWSNVPPKLLACIRFLYKVVHKIGRLRKFNRTREIEFTFFIAWTIFMKLGTLVHHVHGYKMLPQIF